MFGVWGQVGPLTPWIDGTISHTPDLISPANTGKGVNNRSYQNKSPLKYEIYFFFLLYDLVDIGEEGKIRRNNTEGTTLVLNRT